MRDGSSTAPALRQALPCMMGAHMPRMTGLLSNVERLLRLLSVASGMERSWFVTWTNTASAFSFIACFFQLTESVVRSMPRSKKSSFCDIGRIAWSAQRCKSLLGRQSATAAQGKPLWARRRLPPILATPVLPAVSDKPYEQTRAKELSVDLPRKKNPQATILEHPAHLSHHRQNTTIDHFKISCRFHPIGSWNHTA